MCGKAYDPRFMFAWPTARLRGNEAWWDAAASHARPKIKLKQLEARRQTSRKRKTKKRMMGGIRPRHLRTSNRSTLRRRTFVGGCHHRSPPHTRDRADDGPSKPPALNPEIREFKTGVPTDVEEVQS